MFAQAYENAKQFTRPVVVSSRLDSGKVNSGIGTFILVNKDGWILTAAHILNNSVAIGQHAKEREAYEQAVKDVKDDTTLNVKQRNRKLERIKPNPAWLSHQSLWWCNNAATIAEAYVDGPADVAIARLNNFDLTGQTTFPTFKKTVDNPPPGRSFCRLGFAFAEVTCTFDDATGGFVMQNFTPPPMFPNDGIHTRTMLVKVEPANTRTVRFIETSTPGLMGQSGGPLFDVDGVIWGVQSHTRFLDLGFSPKKEGSTEHQFMNVGMASHIQHAIDLFDQHNVQYNAVP